jgi:RNA-directed DNA polymerase
MFALGPEVLQRLDIPAALDRELEYSPPYLPTLSSVRAVRSHREDYARLLEGRFVTGADLVPAEILQVPKRRGGLRPVTLLPLGERVLFRALVEAIEDRVPAPDRSHEAKDRFEQSPLEDSSNRFVVVADVASFYPSIDHGLVHTEIVSQTGEALLAETLTEFLSLVTGRQFGLPQVYYASDLLSELVIDVAERALLRAGVSVWRYNDDFRLGARTWPEANSGLAKLEQETRRLGFTLNDYKTYPLTRERYETWRAEPGLRWSEFTDEVQIDLRTVGYGDEPVEPDTQAIIPPAAVAALERVLRSDDVARDRLGEEVDRQLVGAAVAALHFVGSTDGVFYTEDLLASEPQLTHRLADYLTVATSTAEEEVVSAITGAVYRSDLYLSDWQALWLLNPLMTASALPEETLGWVRTLLAPTHSGLVRGRAALTLSLYDAIDEKALGALYGELDEGSSGEVVGALAHCGDASSVIRAATAKESPINTWILNELSE